MKFTILIALLFLIQGATGQTRADSPTIFGTTFITTFGEEPSIYDRVGILEKQIAFLTRDCIDTHRRLDSLIGEMKNVFKIDPNPPGQWWQHQSQWDTARINTFVSEDTMREWPRVVTDNAILIRDLWAWGRNKSPVISDWGDNAMGLNVDTLVLWPEETKITISNETPSTKWRHVDRALYQVRGYILSLDGKPVYRDHNKKAFPPYIKIWP